MTDIGIEKKAEAIAEPIIESMGMELVDIEYRREQVGWVLRLYIDKEGGVILDDCSSVSREVGAAIEIEDMVDHHYSLEVSSPGLTRPLKKLKDFERFKGSYSKVKLFSPLEGNKIFRGDIVDVKDETITFNIDGKEIEIKFKDIAKANLEFK